MIDEKFMTFSILLPIHILLGCVAVLSAIIALSCKKGANLHRKAGVLFMIGMLGISVTAIPMAILTANWFLFCIASFSA